MENPKRGVKAALRGAQYLAVASLFWKGKAEGEAGYLQSLATEVRDREVRS